MLSRKDRLTRRELSLAELRLANIRKGTEPSGETGLRVARAKLWTSEGWHGSDRLAEMGRFQITSDKGRTDGGRHAARLVCHDKPVNTSPANEHHPSAPLPRGSPVGHSAVECL